MSTQYTIKHIAVAIKDYAAAEATKEAAKKVIAYALSDKFTIESRANKGSNAKALLDALSELGLNRQVCRNYLTALRYAKKHGIKADRFTFNLERLKERVNGKGKKETAKKETAKKETAKKSDGKLKTHGDALELIGQTAANLLKTTEKYHEKIGSDVLEALQYLAALNG